MSLLGNNVFANPTTPLWGPQGSSSNLIVPPGGQITFQGSPNQALTLTDGTITTLDASGNYASSSAGEFRAYDNVGSYVAIGPYSTQPLGLRAFLIDGTLQNTFAQFDSGGWDLSNVLSVNGVPYFNAPGTNFSYSNYPGGSPLAEAPDWTVLNSLNFTPPVNGKVYIESLGTYVGTVLGGTTVMNFAINGVDAPVEPTKTQAYDSNINFTGTSFYSFPVNANTVYDISSIAQCSALPPAGADSVVTSSRMFLMFSPQ